MIKAASQIFLKIFNDNNLCCSMISLLTFGKYQVRSNGIPVDLPFKASLALAILAHSPRRYMARSTLAAWLWPTSEKAGHSLDQAAYVLRKYMGANMLSSEGGQLTLREQVDSDYWQVLGLL